MPCRITISPTRFESSFADSAAVEADRSRHIYNRQRARLRTWIRRCRTLTARP